MGFQKPAPKGNKYAAHDKPWTDALKRVLAQLETKDEEGKPIVKAGEALRHIAEQTVMQALEGDKDARREIADRLDGKPKELLDVTHHKDPKEMSTDELAADILRTRATQAEGRRATAKGGSQEKPTSLH